MLIIAHAAAFWICCNFLNDLQDWALKHSTVMDLWLNSFFSANTSYLWLQKQEKTDWNTVFPTSNSCTPSPRPQTWSKHLHHQLHPHEIPNNYPGFCCIQNSYPLSNLWIKLCWESPIIHQYPLFIHHPAFLAPTKAQSGVECNSHQDQSVFCCCWKW